MTTPDAFPQEDFIHLVLNRGTLLILHAREYRAAIQRGKAFRRAQLQAKREAQSHAKSESDTLNWIGEL